MNKNFLLMLLTLAALPVGAQQVLTLDSCRAMALRNNKQLSVSKVKQNVAANIRKSARTKYLPHVSALGGYEWTSKEVSILNDDQKSALSNLGTNLTTPIGQGIQQGLADMPEGVWQTLGTMGISPEIVQQHLSSGLNQFSGMLNAGGQRVVDAFRTDTRNMFAGAIMVTQPVFMGGAIIAPANIFRVVEA